MKMFNQLSPSGTLWSAYIVDIQTWTNHLRSKVVERKMWTLSRRSNLREAIERLRLYQGYLHEIHTLTFLTNEFRTWKKFSCFQSAMKNITTIEIFTINITSTWKKLGKFFKDYFPAKLLHLKSELNQFYFFIT